MGKWNMDRTPAYRCIAVRRCFLRGGHFAAALSVCRMVSTSGITVEMYGKTVEMSLSDWRKSQ